MKIKNYPHFTSLSTAIETLFGQDTKIARTDRLSGGDINKSYGLTLTQGSHVLMKANEKNKLPFFTAEAASISAIASTKTIMTPQILCTGTDNGEISGYSFLLMNYIESSPAKADYWELLGRELAQLHQAKTDSFTQGLKFGFFEDNFIGSRKQKNKCSNSWVDFFRQERLEVQFKDADSYFTSEDRKLNEKLLSHLEDFISEPAYPSLLHGDLWSGNIICNSEGKAALIDPASYVGNREADIAMTELFGGFAPSFYSAYREALPLEKSYEESRDLYNLYHILNHLNIFGRNYLQPVRDIVRAYTA